MKKDAKVVKRIDVRLTNENVIAGFNRILESGDHNPVQLARILVEIGIRHYGEGDRNSSCTNDSDFVALQEEIRTLKNEGKINSKLLVKIYEILTSSEGNK